MQHATNPQAEATLNSALRHLRLHVLERANAPERSANGTPTIGDRLAEAAAANDDRPRFRP